LLDTATADIVGIATEYGPSKMRQSDTGSLYHSLFTPISHAVAEECRRGDRGGVPRVERRAYRDEPIIVSWYDRDDGPVVRDVIRLVAEGDRVASIKFHFFSPASSGCRGGRTATGTGRKKHLRGSNLDDFGGPIITSELRPRGCPCQKVNLVADRWLT
jgi:hypothetical protein